MHMRYRTLGNTGLEVSEIGFGALGIGGVSSDIASYGPTDDRESLAALERAFADGITFYDTSPDYGNGRSEELIGRAFRGKRDDVVIASKVGFVSLSRPNDQVAIRESLAAVNIRQTLEGTLRRLQTDYLDLLQLHSPPLEILRDMPEIFSTLEGLRQDGKIRAWGISLRSPADGVAAVSEFSAPVLQVNFNMIDQRALDIGLLDLAREKNVGVITRTPFSYGFLTGKYADAKFDPRDHRSQQPPERLEKWAAAPRLFQPFNNDKERTLAQLALQFCLASSSVSTVIPGMMRPAEVDENSRALEVEPLGAEEFTAIREVYRTHSFFG